ncbi:MAG TPA: DinB family protein [Symbiobacteriaceae bacterium]|nr:DinB family protein [Symbiobacteriaceae bacterium]
MPQQVDAVMNRARAVRNLILAEVEKATAEEMNYKPGARWSAREVLIHIGNWEAEGVRWLPYFLKGETPPEQEHKPIDELNAQMMEPYIGLDVAGVLNYLAETRAQLEALAAQITDEHLKKTTAFMGTLLMCVDHDLGHLHQLREALAAARGDVVEAAIANLRYHRQRVLTRLNLEFRSTESLTWRPADGKWTVKENLIHLAVWDRGAVGVFAAIAEGRPVPAMPFPEGGLDEWNKAQVNAASWMSLADVINELGAAREAMELQIRRLTPEQVASSPAKDWLGFGEHDKEHMYKILDRLQGWRQAQAK